MGTFWNGSPGAKYVNYDDHFWADHDPDCHGDPESFEDDPDFAEGFKWDCCEKDGSASGCVTTKHRPRKYKILKK